MPTAAPPECRADDLVCPSTAHVGQPTPAAVFVCCHHEWTQSARDLHFKVARARSPASRFSMVPTLEHVWGSLWKSGPLRSMLLAERGLSPGLFQYG